MLQKKHEHLIRETTIHYNQRLEELTSELQSSANKIVVQDIREYRKKQIINQWINICNK